MRDSRGHGEATVLDGSEVRLWEWRETALRQLPIMNLNARYRRLARLLRSNWSVSQSTYRLDICPQALSSSAKVWMHVASDFLFKENVMAKDAHHKAAEHHDNAAKAHRTAAEHHGKGDHEQGKKHSAIAHEHSGKAHQASQDAHQKSQSQK